MGEGKYRVAIKDNIDVAGFTTTCGSKALSKSLPARNNADVVDQLLKNDCELVGKVTMHELAFGMSGINDWAGTPVNTRYPDLIPGGSSSGSATVVAAGEVDFSIGTDTGGSIRFPAACCAVVGFKPTLNRVSRKGIHPSNSSLDCVGIFANSVHVLGNAMEMVDRSFSWSSAAFTLKEVRIANLACDCLPIIDLALKTILGELELKTQILGVETFDSANDAAKLIMGYEMYKEFKYLLPYEELGSDIRKRLELATDISKPDIEQAYQTKEQFSNELSALFKTFDLLLLPTLPDFPMPLSLASRGENVLPLSALVRPFNLSGNPAVSIPMGEVNNKPISLQIVGNLGADELVCQAAFLFSQAFTELGVTK